MGKCHEAPDRWVSSEIPVDANWLLTDLSKIPDEDQEDSTPEIQRAVAAAMASLGDEERFIFESNLIARVPLREIAETLGVSKTKVFNMREAAKAKLVKLLMVEDSVTERYSTLEKSWNDACRGALMELAPIGRPRSMFPLDAQWRRLKQHVAAADDTMICFVLGQIARIAADELDAAGEWSIDEMEHLLCSKQHDYGHENILAFGQVGLGVRMSDKLARYFNLQGKPAANESLLDTKRDMVGYGAISLMLANNTFMLPLTWPVD